MAMRLELSQSGDAFLSGNYQLYNVLVTSHAFLMIFLCAVSVVFVYNCKIRVLNLLPNFTKLLGLFGCPIKRLTYFKGKLIKDNSMSLKRRCGVVDCPKNSMWAKLAMVRGGFSKFEFQHDLHGRYFQYQLNIFNTTEVRRRWHVDKLLNCKLVYTNETDDNLRLESQIFANSRVILVKHNKLIMLMGLPKSCKRYGNGVFIVAAKSRFYTTSVIGSEGEGKQSISSLSLNRSFKFKPFKLTRLRQRGHY